MLARSPFTTRALAGARTTMDGAGRGLRRSRAGRATAVLLGVSLVATGCSLAGGDDEAADKSTTVTLVAHESFSLPKELIAAFEKDSGYQLKISKLADAGTLTNQLVLTKDDPVGDVVFGIDNTYASRAVEEGVFAPYEPTLPAGAADKELPGDDGNALTPVDAANVCVNVDTAWFAKKKLAPPTSLDDLLDPAYRDLMVLPGASTSSPGLAFLLLTIRQQGDAWSQWWEKLMANGAKVVKGWSDAYYTDFSFSGGDRPIVVSYDSSPAFTLDEAEKKTTTAIIDDCYEQVEYAGVLRGNEDDETNEAGARAVIDWLVSDEVQAALPESMYVFPVSSDVTLPDVWARFAVPAMTTGQVDPREVSTQRQSWIEEWNEIVSR